MIEAYISQSLNKELIKKSSSGGIFAELAKYVLSQSGVVFGCTMERVEDGFDVKHIYIENEKELYKLQGSKYVQSNLGNTIKETKEFLDKGRLVLFSGTPCQIAGLKAYLKQDYKNLLTVDLSCTGTPTLKIFNDYIKFLENKFKQKIIKFEFRNKDKMGWSCGNALITLENGKEKIIYNNTSSYLNLFINKKIQASSCQNCKFSGLERISDITIADAWGVENEYSALVKKNFNKNKGISLVMINTEQGKNFYDFIQENLIAEKIKINKLAKYNAPLLNHKSKSELKYIEVYKRNGYLGIENLFRKELDKKYYYYILKNHTPKLIKSIIKIFMSKQEKTDCLLMTGYALSNYGSLLTAYALQKTISELGYSSKIINYASTYGFAKNFNKKYLQCTKLAITNKDYYKLNRLSDTFILGSDNLINLETNKFNAVAKNLFNYTENNKKRIMISGSIGSWDGSTKTQADYDYLKYLLDRFDYLSTREEYGKQVFENVYGVEADWINDPVFYLEKQDFIDLTKDVKEDYSNNIMQYILYPTEKTLEIANYYKQKTGLEAVKFEGNENVMPFVCKKNESVENWLAAIINSKLIITDSFHCIAFAIIFNKPFICIKNTRATVRFLSLFKRLGINIQLIESVDDLKNINMDYNKEQVNKMLIEIREYAIEKIEQAMLTPKKDFEDKKIMTEYNQNFIKKNAPWYKRNKWFYLLFITNIAVPIIKLKKYLEGKCK